MKVRSYGFSVIDGRQRVVKYAADGARFRASISTNEQGTAPFVSAAAAAAAAYNAPPAVAMASSSIVGAASYAAPLLLLLL